MSARSFVIENGFERTDIRDEVRHLEEFSKLRRASAAENGEVSAVTITFLASDRHPDKDVGTIDARRVIGQVTIITFPVWDTAKGKVEQRSYIYEAIFRLPSKAPTSEQLEGNPPQSPYFQQILNNYVPVSRELEIHFRGRRASFRASYFCQQNGITSICGHCAVRTLVRIVAEKHVTVPQLNDFWNYVEKEEVKVDDIEDALARFGRLGVKKFRLDMRPAPGRSPVEEIACTPDEIWNMLSRMADSAVASLLILSSGPPEPDKDHIVPVLGHTFNSDEWHPLGTDLHRNGDSACATSTLWVDHLVLHDDMLGPYYCLSRGGLFPGQARRLTIDEVRALMPDIKLTGPQAEDIARRLAPGEQLEPKLTAKQVLAVLPAEIVRTPIEAENLAQLMLGLVESRIKESGLAQGRWWDYFGKCFERRVLRTTLVKKNEYLESLLGYVDTKGAPQSHKLNEEQDRLSKQLASILPYQFWLTEITLPNLLLANRAKLGELLIDPSKFLDDNDEVMDALFAFRMPSVFGVGFPGDNGQRELAIVRWPEEGHRPVLRDYHSNPW